VLNDPRVVQLFELLTEAENASLRPVFAPRSDGWASYPEVEERLGIDAGYAARLLEDLHRLGYLRREFHENVQFCPACNSQDLKLVSRCPKCGSQWLVRKRVIEHKACGFRAPEEDFERAGARSCPKCRTDMVLAGADYEDRGTRYRCGDCAELVETPAEEWRCRACQRVFGKTMLGEEALYRYAVNQAQLARVRLERIPKARVRDYLTREGYEVQETVRTVGRSGAEHEIDLLATKRSGPLEHRIVVGFACAEQPVDSEEVIKLYAKAYDVNAQDIIMVASPRLSDDARSFAGHYHIKVYDSEQLSRSDLEMKV
jgi:predicted Zn-ribbon and HTH transcriptional regulator